MRKRFQEPFRHQFKTRPVYPQEQRSGRFYCFRDSSPENGPPIVAGTLRRAVRRRGVGSTSENTSREAAW